MKQIKQKKDQCLITTLAMLTGDDVELISARLNQEILHIQECQDYMFKWHGSHLVNIVKRPAINVRGKLRACGDIKRFLNYLEYQPAILISESHAYGWDGETCYCPREGIIELPDDVDEAFLIIKSV